MSRGDSGVLWKRCPSVYPIRTQCWLMGLFASRLHTSVGPFALSAGPLVGVFAQSAGRHKALFASPRVPVRKPLHLAPSPWPGGTFTPVPGLAPLTMHGPATWEGLAACVHDWRPYTIQPGHTDDGQAGSTLQGGKRTAGTEAYACRHTLRAEARRMAASSGRSTDEGMTPRSCPPR